LIPSFVIMGIRADGESMAKKIQEYASLTDKDRQARTSQQTDEIPEMVFKLDKICSQACSELEEEFNKLKEAS